MNAEKSYLIASIFSLINGIIIGAIIGKKVGLLWGLLFATVLTLSLSVFYWIMILGLSNKTKELKSKNVLLIGMCGIIFVNIFVIVMTNWMWDIGITFLIRLVLSLICIIAFCGMFYFGVKLLQESERNT